MEERSTFIVDRQTLSAAAVETASPEFLLDRTDGAVDH
jgi:hypothetical protein